jgi:hypothetical protein
LASYGGVYAREDVVISKPIDGLLHDCTCFLTLDNPYHAKKLKMVRSLVSSIVFGSTPGHPFWYSVFYSLKGCQKASTTLSRTGALMLTETIRILYMTEKPDIAIYEHGFFYPNHDTQPIPKGVPGMGHCTWTFKPDNNSSDDTLTLPPPLESIAPRSEKPKVFVSILVRNKAHVRIFYILSHFARSSLNIWIASLIFLMTRGKCISMSIPTITMIIATR